MPSVVEISGCGQRLSDKSVISARVDCAIAYHDDDDDDDDDEDDVAISIK